MRTDPMAANALEERVTQLLEKAKSSLSKALEGVLDEASDAPIAQLMNKLENRTDSLKVERDKVRAVHDRK